MTDTDNIRLGGTDAATVMGHGWESPLNLYYRLRGEVEESDEQTARMDAGSRFESVIIGEVLGRYLPSAKLLAEDELRRMAGVQVAVDDLGLLMVSRTHRWMSCHPDGIVELEDGTRALLEAKYVESPSRAQLWSREAWSDDIPEGVIYQCLHNLEVTGLDVAYVPAYLTGRGFVPYRVERNQAILDTLLAAEQEMVRRVLEGDPPDPVTPEDLKLRWLAEHERMVPATPEILEAVVERARLKEKAKEIAEAIKERELEIQRAMEDATVLVDERHEPIMSWKPNRVFDAAEAEAWLMEHDPETLQQATETRIKTTTLKKLRPELYARCMRPPQNVQEQTRVFRVMRGLKDHLKEES